MNKPMLRHALLNSLLIIGMAACASDTTLPDEPGQPIDVSPSESQTAAIEAIETELTDTQNLTPEELIERYPTFQVEQIDYDPTQASRLDLIQSSALALDAAERAVYDTNGFVISGRQSFPSFLYGYETIYMQDLPVYVSADVVMHAVHSSYSEILKTLEVNALTPELGAMLDGMRRQLAQGAVTPLGPQTEADIDLYLTVALSLLQGSVATPVAGGNAADIQNFVGLANQGEGAQNIRLFGVSRNMDFSQFTPRGHYTDSPALERYFRAMMWLGRVDLRIVETQPDHSQIFHRRQLEGAYGLRLAMDAASVARWEKIDGTIEAFVGEPDNMTLTELDGLLADLGVNDATDLTALSDAEIAKAVLQGGYGTQQISSHIMINGLGERTMPLSSTFLLLGQRYVVDSHVFSNVVFDRVQRGEVHRMMPDPLDVAFAALGNNQAAGLLKTELQDYRYSPDLHAMRFLTEDHGDEFWGKNLYNRWLSALRALSPTDELQHPEQYGLPELATTEAWGRRLLNTQMASWAELRHDTILYAKQSYTGGEACEFPDAYVDPYPLFFEAIVHFAQHARQIVTNLNLGTAAPIAEINDYFDELEQHASTLQQMAEQQRNGVPFTEEQLAWINEAVVVHEGCGSPAGADGWLARLYYDRAKAAQWDPTIADVHTQPTDEAGNPVGRVLHVGTGGPRLMVVAVPTCTGVHAYAGLVSSYFEHTTEAFERLNDAQWSQQFSQPQTPVDVPWLNGLIAY